MITLGEARAQVEGHVGDGRPAHAIDRAIKMAYKAAIGMAVQLTSDRMVHPLRMDLVNGRKEYELPEELYAVRRVVRHDRTPSRALSPLTAIQGAQVDTSAFARPFGVGEQPYYGYWVEHRTLNIRPEPTATTGDGLTVWGWIVPPLPFGPKIEEVMPIPEGAEAFILAKAAWLVVPAPSSNREAQLEKRLADIAGDFREWLVNSVRDVGPVVTMEGEH